MKGQLFKVVSKAEQDQIIYARNYKTINGITQKYRAQLEDEGKIFCDICSKEKPQEGATIYSESGIDECSECHAEWLETVKKCPHKNLIENIEDPGTAVCEDCLSGGHKFPEKDIDYEAKEHHGSYADDDKDCKHEESINGLCIECGEPFQMGLPG